jgi:AraC-like DNA-binding protein
MPRAPVEVSVTIVRAVIEAAKAEGVDVDPILAEAGLSTAELAEDDLYVPAPAEERVWRATVERVQDPCFGTKAAQRLTIGSFRELEYLARTSETLGEGLTRMVTYDHLIHGMDIFELSVGESQARLRYLHPHGRDEPHAHAATQFALAAVLHTARDATGRDWDPQLVKLAMPEPPDTSAMQAYYRAPLRFGDQHSELVLDTALLDLPMTAADPTLRSVLESYVHKALDRIQGPTSTSALVRKTLGAARPLGSVSLDDVARKFDLTPRGLQRRLQSEGTSYQQLLDDVRREAAEFYVAQAMSSAAIALMLGFSDVRSFRRAFKRWFEETPQQYRRRLKMSAE